MSSRARRRHDLRRMKAKAVRVFSKWDHTIYRGGGEKPDTKRYEKWADHLKMCSCYGCGNPRRWFGEKTIQERRFGSSIGKTPLW